MSSRLKDWAMNTPEFRRSEQQAELGPGDSEYWLDKLESQLPESQRLREELRNERERDQAKA